MADALDALTDFIATGRAVTAPNVAAVVAPLFGSRYHKRHWDADPSKNGVRDAYRLADGDGAGVPFGALIHPDNPSSGAYGGFSLAWFPAGKGSLISLVVGTRGLQPDESILTRPGHRRRVASLRRYLARKGVACWSKADPAAISTEMPKSARQALAGDGDEAASFSRAMERYESVLYCVARVPSDNPAIARTIVAAFIDLYAFERGWNVNKEAKADYDAFHGELRADVHQVLAYAALYDARKVTATLVYPLRQETYEDLAARGHDRTVASLYHGHRELTLELRGMPFGSGAKFLGLPHGRLEAGHITQIST